MTKRVGILVAWRVACLSAALLGAHRLDAAPLNVILFIGDGMGAEHIEAGRYFFNGGAQPLAIETLTYAGLMTHNNASDGTTDSAASATAMATGQKVNNGVLSAAIPGDGADLTTALEIFQSRGKRTGLVTSHTAITDATPAAFAAHNPSRNNHAAIASDMFFVTRPNVLFGGTGAAVNPQLAAAAGYQVVPDRSQLAGLDANAAEFVSGQFHFGTGGAPTLAEMTAAALDVLDGDPDGLFLMVEHEETDSGGHANDIGRVVRAVVELDAAVQTALAWSAARGGADQTLILVTADHETGGLATLAANGAGNLPTVSWGTTGHTQTPVPILAAGPPADASRVADGIDNADLFHILMSTMPAEPQRPLHTVAFQNGAAGYGATTDTFLQQDPANANTYNGQSSSLNVDSDDPGGTGRDAQALLRFGDVFGDAPGQIPPAAVIESATLELRVTNAGDAIKLHRMLTPWDQSATWNSFVGGVQADGVEAQPLADVETGAVSAGGLRIDVAPSLMAWQSDPAANYGWLLAPTGLNGVDFDSSEGLEPPRLSVSFASINADFDGGGHVDAADLAVWKDQFGQTWVDPPMNGQNADGDSDGDIDGTDFLTWQRQLGSPMIAATEVVPEPKTLLLIVSGALAMFLRGRVAMS